MKAAALIPLVMLSIACEVSSGDLPAPPPLARWDGGYAIEPRPFCSEAVRTAG
jgi:hypothetical protein